MMSHPLLNGWGDVAKSNVKKPIPNKTVPKMSNEEKKSDGGSSNSSATAGANERQVSIRSLEGETDITSNSDSPVKEGGPVKVGTTAISGPPACAWAEALKHCPVAQELKPFVRDSTDKKFLNGCCGGPGLVLSGVKTVSSGDIRSAAEKFGALVSFRTDFLTTKGLVFFTYCDLRAARDAANSMVPSLYPLLGKSETPCFLNYCTPLHNSSSVEEHALIVRNLSDDVDETVVLERMSSYGDVKAVHEQAASVSLAVEEDEDGGEGDNSNSFMVLFYDSQDAKQAHLELNNANPFGPGVVVEFCPRNKSQRKLGKKLLDLISEWRHGSSVAREGDAGIGNGTGNGNGTGTGTGTGTGVGGRQSASASASTSPQQTLYAASAPSHTQQRRHPSQFQPQQHMQQQFGEGYGGPLQPNPQQQQQIPPSVVDNSQFPQYVPHQFQQQHHYPPPQQQQRYPWSPHAQHQHQQPGAMVNNGWVAGVGGYGVGGMYAAPSWQQQQQQAQQQNQQVQFLQKQKNLKQRQAARAPEDPALALDIDDVESGKDTRTSLMVRNIPNKYTQSMFLDEIRAGGHGDKIDFFYLPIDFKNKCNRGYCFVNFINSSAIGPFYRQYNTKSWKNFNSDKVCAIKWARIQGKAAMIKRFENSALLEKEGEYRPLVFNEKGEPEEFPSR